LAASSHHAVQPFHDHVGLMGLSFILLPHGQVEEVSLHLGEHLPLEEAPAGELVDNLFNFREEGSKLLHVFRGKFGSFQISGFQILLTITSFLFTSQESLSTHFKAKCILFHMNGVLAHRDSFSEHESKKNKVYRVLWDTL
jgi:hypothetical protein